MPTTTLKKPDHWDGGDHGSPGKPSIWVFGIEYGEAPDKRSPKEGSNIDYQDIDYQLGFRYGQNLFKLLAIMNGYPISDFKKFARQYQPFTQKSKGYYRGNLYPVPRNRNKPWDEHMKRETGFEIEK